MKNILTALLFVPLIGAELNESLSFFDEAFYGETPELMYLDLGPVVKISRKSSTNGYVYICNCGKEFLYKNSLRDHLLDDHFIKFSVDQELTSYIKKALEKRYCAICKAVVTRTNYPRHLRTKKHRQVVEMLGEE
ncbi:hypothetical protein A3F66_02550 [candidate division TM6 bacterium RIFCSPHIGHO2_12_FULL_32_22]|nr:MAG: hypothetical protein A3F66_02550 [candidate division TM6 bacterium RIFCSPHIGHO2_12_FULL_32_22]